MSENSAAITRTRKVPVMGVSWVADSTMGGAGRGRVKLGASYVAIGDFEPQEPEAYGTVASSRKRATSILQKFLCCISMHSSFRETIVWDGRMSFHKEFRRIES
jgi:hypothetical protein